MRLTLRAVTLVLVLFSCYVLALVLDPDPTPLRDLVGVYLAVAAVAACSAGSVVILHLERAVVPALVVGATVGSLVGWGLSLATGTGTGDELNGLVFRVGGAALVGCLSVVALRLVARFWP